MKYFFFLLAAALMIGGCTNSTEGADAKPLPPPDPNAVKGDGYSFVPPEGWEVKPLSLGSLTGQTVMSPLKENDDFQENVVIIVEELPKEMTAAEYLDASKGGFPAMLTDYSFVDQGTGEVNGMKISWLTGTHMQGSTKLRFKLYCFPGGDRAVAVTATATDASFDEFAADFEAIANSFRVD